MELAELVRVADFVEELSRELERSASVADLFRTAFRLLHQLMPFDVGATLMLEQTLDLYVARREDADRVVDDPLVAELRRIVQSEIPLALGSADLVPQGDFADLPKAEQIGDPLTFELHVILTIEDRVAGLLAVFRAEEPFDSRAMSLLRILGSHLMFAIASLRSRDQLRDLAETDDLTGVWNRRYMRRRLGSEIDRAKTYNLPLSVAMLDVDDLKPVNDRYGHGMGDVLLSELCGAIRDALRTPDVLARFGGDEFFLMLPHTDIHGARQLAGRLLEVVRSINIQTGDSQSIRPTISMGLASYAGDMTTAELIQRADDRLYDSKRAGRNRFSW